MEAKKMADVGKINKGSDIIQNNGAPAPNKGIS